MSATPTRCIIIDDEPAAQQVLQQYIADVPGLLLTGTCSDALEAVDHLQEQPVDLLFLDINLPRLSGISFLKALPHHPAVILTTAYEEYALQGYELDVVDYLLKPFSFERFLRAVAKVLQAPGRDAADTHLTVRADRKTYRLPCADILYIESTGDYVTIHTADQKITAYNTLKGLQEKLPSDLFLRIHKSYIISLAQLEYLEGNTVTVGGTHLPIGTTYQQTVKERIFRM